MSEDVDIRIRLRDAAQAARGVSQVRSEINDLGPASRRAAAGAAQLGSAVSHAASVGARGLSLLAYHTRYAGVGLLGLAGAGVKWGLSFDAQVESARNRFQLFTNDVQGLTAAVSKIDVSSQFNFADLADAAAMLGNANVQNIPKVLLGAANAAAAGGRGTEGLQSIVLALSQIQNKGRLSQEELNQLAEAGAPGVQQTVANAFGLTAKQLGNVGQQGLDANKAIDALTANWTSGKMAGAAQRQISTLGGQWALFTGNAQKASGALMLGLAGSLEHNVLPALNDVTSKVTAIFGQKGLSNQEKIRRAREVIRTGLGPVWGDIKHDIDQADIPGHLGKAVGLALPAMASGAASAAPKVASAFVHAWLNSGPWAQLLSALYIGKKLGGGSLIGKGISAALTGRAVSKAAGGLTGKGDTPVNPLWVAVVNGNGAPGLPGGAGSKTSTAERIGRKAVGVAKILPPVAAYAALVDALNHTGDPNGPIAQIIRRDRGTNPQITNPRVAGAVLNTNPPPVHVSLKVDGIEIARAITRATDRSFARRAGGP